MRKTILLLTSAITAVLMAAGVALAATPSGTLDANTLSGTSSGSGGWVLVDAFRFGQTFTAKNSGQVTSAQIFVSDHDGGADDLVVEVATLEGGKPSPQSRATATVLDSEISDGTPGLVTANFSEPLTVEAGKQYALVLSMPKPSSAVKVWYNSTLPYPEGQGMWSGTSTTWDESTVWNNFGNDFVFAIYLNGTDKRFRH